VRELRDAAVPDCMSCRCLSPGTFELDACVQHVLSDAGRPCREHGCLARRACPVGQSFGTVTSRRDFTCRRSCSASFEIPAGAVEGAAQSVSGALVDQVLERLAASISMKVLHEELHRQLHPIGIPRTIRAMRRDQYVFHPPERRIVGKRLALEHIERSAGDSPVDERTNQRGFVNHRTSPHIDQDRTRLHHLEFALTDQMLRVARQRAAQTSTSMPRSISCSSPGW